jgi:hypothetical protein
MSGLIVVSYLNFLVVIKQKSTIAHYTLMNYIPVRVLKLVSGMKDHF